MFVRDLASRRQYIEESLNGLIDRLMDSIVIDYFC